ncbi:MAG: SpoVR family protein [Burkholderiales bacterium]|jgi:stage V sporulation protein R|uniref:SpoVR family protein n=1 Tax=Limnobacter sp. TaxID=2003368 RepID=UPI0039BD6BD3|nr:SpoVR family protein [Burkholderiales bacterium]
MAQQLDLAGNEWTFELLRDIDTQLHDIAANKYKLDTFPNQIEVISAEQMLDAYSSGAMPVMYPHWSYGKSFSINEHLYETGQQNLAYEVVINSNPCISYLMEENTMTMQTLVIAHACYGHNSFFKGNYLFRQWTQADAIIDYLVFAKKYVMECEEKYGFDAVEEILDAAHAIQHFGVDRYKRRFESEASLKLKRDDLAEEKRRQYDEIMAKVSPVEAAQIERQQDNYPREPVENILYFIEKEAPKLRDWERELVRIVRKMSQYFYPQGQTKVMNEGWASFWHYTLLNTLYDEKLVSDGFMLEFLTSHTNVVFQPDSRDGRFRALNPYALGFAIFSDIRRMCEKPTEEDKRWFPELAGSGNWLKAIDFAMRNFKDESFIRQFLSPKVIRDFRLFAIADHKTENELFIDSIHNDEGYRRIRTLLANQYSRESMVPDIQVTSYARMTDRSLTLTHMSRRGRPLNVDEAEKTLAQVERLWGFPVHLETSDAH